MLENKSNIYFLTLQSSIFFSWFWSSIFLRTLRQIFDVLSGHFKQNLGSSLIDLDCRNDGNITFQVTTILHEKLCIPVDRVYLVSDVDGSKLENFISINLSESSRHQETVVIALGGLIGLHHEELVVVVVEADCLVVKPPDLVQVPGVVGVCGGGVDGETVRHLHQHEDVPGTGRNQEDPGHDGDEDR